MCEATKKELIIKKTIRKLADNHLKMESSMSEQLRMEISNHGTTLGGYREDLWFDLFRRIIPLKYKVEQNVFIIDSNQNISNEVDIAVFDEQYTPYIFNYGKMKFIPIEAVAIVIECKSKSIKEDQINTWIKSIKKLKTSNQSKVRVYNQGVIDSEKSNGFESSRSTRPIRILCALSTKSAVESFKADFDIILNLKEENKLEKIIENENWTYSEWYKELNFYRTEVSRIKGDKGTLSELKVKDGNDENITLSLTFQLNQLLMLINNPIFFPHQSYVCMFNKILNQGDGSDDSN
ncbi:DUF6602 domain-containing protein [Robertmurraya siralis]|uniref:DUF6602 domain-containing protein n=1 Tax=Robertmurraya siralis TaxID=77777 RepID=UPI0010F503DE|nr:DUF6602 domain-containing protein [Robertmurraya siralis]